MKIKVNPTRQELLELKKRLKRARSGHKLLEDKLESLVQGFLQKVKDAKKLQQKLEEKLPEAFFHFFKTQNLLGEKETRGCLAGLPTAEIEVREKNIFGVKTNEFHVVNKDRVLNNPLSSLPPTCFLKEVNKNLQILFEDLIKYASLEEEIKALAEEIITTKRRVNALEYVFIPEMEKTQKYIFQKLEENERFTHSLLMKLKTLLVS